MNRWTPPDHIRHLAEQAMGGIDTDGDEVGLEAHWRGRTWAFVPNGRGVGDKFADKILRSLDRGDVPTAVLLTHNYMDTRWYHRLLQRHAAFCYLRGRLKFTNELQEIHTPPCGQTVLYFGTDVPKFGDAFSGFGTTSVPV